MLQASCANRRSGVFPRVNKRSTPYSRIFSSFFSFVYPTQKIGEVLQPAADILSWSNWARIGVVLGTSAPVTGDRTEFPIGNCNCRKNRVEDKTQKKEETSVPLGRCCFYNKTTPPPHRSLLRQCVLDAINLFFSSSCRVLHLSHRDAWKAAGGCWAAAIVILGAGATLKDNDDTGWNVCLGLMGLFLLGAGAATVFAFWWKIREARREEAARQQREGYSTEEVENTLHDAAGLA